ncbi:MBL fold metallo-hydrolase [Geminicoccus flavidas]|uniref:MBL fold metallo-hydrolase n=1 Tax=Geminicoccus flavidas TaxID=2506407 RepID=UPI00135B718F|nr:MBL fold metallo-hydrolase [Geminicoccus flavidas]
MCTLKAAVVPVTPFRQNCTILFDDASGVGTVVDPGGDVPMILAALSRHGVKVEQILLTHGHVDHAAGAALLQEQLNASGTEGAPIIPVVGPDRRDAFLLEGLEQQALQFGIEGARNLVPDRWLAEGEQVTIAGHPFDVLHCPGHTPGHLAFAAPGLGFAILGDVLFHGSVGRTDFPYGDTDALIRSIRTKILPLGDDIAFICGHGPGSTIGAERLGNPFLQG